VNSVDGTGSGYVTAKKLGVIGSIIEIMVDDVV